MALYEKYRPRDFDDIVGKANEQTIKSLSGMAEKSDFPHCILFTGETGSGKTTLARIVAMKLLPSSEDYEYGLYEENMSHRTGVADTREIGDASRTVSMAASGKKVYILDEIHNISKQGQDNLLKYFEGVPNHLFWICCTDSPEKVDKALRGRCIQFEMHKPALEEMTGYLQLVSTKEEKPISAEIAKHIADNSNDMRAALQNLEKVLVLPELDMEAAEKAIQDNDDTKTNWFNVLIKPLVWPFMIKNEGISNPYHPDYILPKFKELIDEFGAIELSMCVAGYCRNRLTSGKIGVTAKGVKKKAATAAREFFILTELLKVFSITYAHIPKPENRMISEFISFLQRADNNGQSWWLG